MQSFIETQNIAHFKLLLETETHRTSVKSCCSYWRRKKRSAPPMSRQNVRRTGASVSETCRIRPPRGKTIEFNVNIPRCSDALDD
jgi:hypothetical protein